MSERFELIDAEKDTVTESGQRRYTITQMCRWLEVSTSGYYEWRDRPASATAERRARLAAAVQRIFDESDETYGHRRIHAQLARNGERATPELVRAVMRDLGLVPCQPRPWRYGLTDGDPAAALPDLVRRDFTAAAPGLKLVGDITYVPTWEGWVYLLVTVIDCCTKEVIGWAMDDNYKTPLIDAAIRMAARNHDLVPGAIFHSDRGSNYSKRSPPVTPTPEPPPSTNPPSRICESSTRWKVGPLDQYPPLDVSASSGPSWRCASVHRRFLAGR